jgi:hypothetical protein
MNYRCWEESSGSEPSGDGRFEADSPEEAAEIYVSRVYDVDFSLVDSIGVNVSAPVAGGRAYWTVDVAIEMAPSFVARKAVCREDAP